MAEHAPGTVGPTAGHDDSEDALRFVEVSTSLGNRLVLDALSFSAYPGRILGLAGGNGSGKSTVVRLLSGHLQPDSGSVLLHGRPVRSYRRLSDHVGVLGDMIGVPTDMSVQRALEMMQHLLELAPDVLADALHLYDKRHVAVGTLSRGWQQRVKLTVALAGRGRLLVLDEPTNGLDAPSKDWLREHLSQRRDRGDAVVLVTHEYPELERLVDELVVLRQHVRYAGPVLSSVDYSTMLGAA